MRRSHTFSSKTSWNPASNALSEKMREYRLQDIRILDLTVSNPTQVSFSYQTEALLDPLKNSLNLLYDPQPYGLPEARKAVVHYYDRKGIRLKPDQILLTASTSEAYSFVFKLLMEPGQSLLVPKPSYPLLDYLIPLNDISLRRYPLHRKDRRWSLPSFDPPDDSSKDIRAVLVVHPNNPTGHYTTSLERKELTDFCSKNYTALIADEVFLDYSLDPHFEPRSFADNQDCLTLTLSGISKILGLPQMKLSWIVVSGPEKLRTEAIQRLEIISDTYLSTSTPVQNALPHWFKNQDAIQKEIRQRIQSNWFFLKKELLGSSGIQAIPPEGGWNVVLELPSHQNDEAWALEILEKEKVLFHPGYLFDFEEGSFLVASLLTKTDLFQEGIQKIKSYVSST